MTLPVNVLFAIAKHSYEAHAQFMRHDPYRVHALGLLPLSEAADEEAGYVATPALLRLREALTLVWRLEETPVSGLRCRMFYPPPRSRYTRSIVSHDALYPVILSHFGESSYVLCVLAVYEQGCTVYFKMKKQPQNLYSYVAHKWAKEKSWQPCNKLSVSTFAYSGKVSLRLSGQKLPIYGDGGVSLQLSNAAIESIVFDEQSGEVLQVSVAAKEADLPLAQLRRVDVLKESGIVACNYNTTDEMDEWLYGFTRLVHAASSDELKKTLKWSWTAPLPGEKLFLTDF